MHFGRRRALVIGALVMLAARCLAHTSEVRADTLLGVVVGIQDGDTITVLDGAKTQHKIRLAGIDAPEKRQPFGARAKRQLSDMAYRMEVAVEWSKVDRYGRLVGKVLVNGRDVNLAQVDAGMAWHYREYAREQSPSDRVRYADAETRAREARLGLWSDASPTPPWDYRRALRDGISNGAAQAPAEGPRPRSPTPSAQPLLARSPAATSTQLNIPPTCYVGPRGGTYTLTPSGKKNYGGC